VAQQIVEIRAVDKTGQVFANINKNLRGIEINTSRIGKGFGGLQSKILAIGSAIGAAFGAKAILKTASDVEQLGVRFQFLFGSVEEGNKAFQAMLDYAGKVPFTLQQIQAGAGSLAVISDNAEELSKNMQIVGNVAAVAGLDFATTANQIQRAFAGGAAAAEIFRERGILALLGFQAGAKVTAAETAKRFEEVFGKGGRFENATLALANTYEGVLSMIQDKIFKFTLALGNQGGLLNFAKGILGTLDQILTEQFGSIEKFAELAGRRIIEVVQQFAIGVARIADLVTPAFQLVAEGINVLVNFVNALPPMIREFGIIGFFLLGPKFKLLLVVAAGLFDKILDLIGFVVKGAEGLANKVVDAVNVVLGGINKARAFVGNDPIPLLERFTFGGDSPDHFKNMVKDGFGDLMKSLGATEQEAGKLETVVMKFFSAVDLTIEQQAKLKKKIEETIAASRGVTPEQYKVNEAMAKTVKSIQDQSDKIKGLTTDQKVALELEKLKVDELLGQVKASDDIKNAKRQEIEDLVRANILLEQRKELEAALGGLGAGFEDFDPEKRRQEELQKLIEQGVQDRVLTEAQGQAAIERIKLESARRQKAIEEQRIKETIDLIKKGQAEQVDFDKLTNKERMSVAIGFGKDILGQLAQQNEKAFQIQKALAIAEALIQARAAVVSAYKFGSTFGGPIGGAIFAALAVAATAAQISAIRNTQYTGPREKGGPVGPNQTYLVGEGGPELLKMGPQGGTVVPNNQLGQQPVLVNFNITTNDARGFDELLVERRSTIVGIINQAMNSRGRTGVTA